MVNMRRQKEAPRKVDHLLRLLPWYFGVCSFASLHANAQGGQARSPLGASQIIETMQARHLPTRGVQIKLVAPITSASANPSLEIQSVVPLSSYDVRLRIACQDHAECLPFFAVVRYPEAIDSSVFQIRSGSQSIALTETSSAAKPIADKFLPSIFSKPLNAAEPRMVHSGSPATLDFDGDRVHIRVEVICLENGATGDKIRVTTRDHKQIYVAEVIAPKALKGTFKK